MPFLLFGSFLIASALGLRSTARVGDDQGGYAPPPYAPPQGYSHPPQNISGQGYGASAYYAQPVEEQYSYAPPANEVRLYGENGGYAFYANVEYGGQIMNMMVDTGATYCVVGDEVYTWLRPSIGRATRRAIRNADGRTTDVTLFTLPYLTVGDGQWQSTVTARNVEMAHMPGSGCGLLGQSFLRQCDVRQSGGVMTVRGR